MEYSYRQLFGLSYRELMDEPYDKFLLNLRIAAILQKKEIKDIQWQQRMSKR